MINFQAKILSGKHSVLLIPGLIFASAFCIRLAYFINKGIISGGDTSDYLKLADNVYKFGAYSLGDVPDLPPSIRRPPLYPYFLAFLQWIEGGILSYQSVAVAQVTLNSFVAAAIFLIAKKAVSKQMALFAALVYVIYPDAIYRTTVILTESFFTFMLTAAVLVFVYAFERNNLWLTIFGSVLLGLAVLCRPIAAFIPFVLIPIVLFKFKPPQRYVYAGVITIVFSLTLLPWLVRNYQVTGQFVFIQSSGSAQLFYGTKPVEMDKINTPFADKVEAAKNPQEVLAADKFGREEAVKKILDSPKDYVLSRLKVYPYLFLDSFDDFTGFDISFGTAFREKKFFILALKSSLLIFFTLLPFLLSFVGLFKVKKNITMMLCASIWLAILLIHIPLWIEYRFWSPAVPFQLVSAAVGITILQKRFGRVSNL